MHTFKLLIRKDQEKVAFMWNGQQYSLTVFLQDYINSPTTDCDIDYYTDDLVLMLHWLLYKTGG